MAWACCSPSPALLPLCAGQWAAWTPCVYPGIGPRWVHEQKYEKLAGLIMHKTLGLALGRGETRVKPSEARMQQEQNTDSLCGAGARARGVGVGGPAQPSCLHPLNPTALML